MGARLRTMQRRDFIHRTLPLLAIGSTGIGAASFPAQAGEFTGTIKKAVKFRDVNEPDLSIEDRFRLGRRYQMHRTLNSPLHNHHFILDNRRQVNFGSAIALEAESVDIKRSMKRRSMIGFYG